MPYTTDADYYCRVYELLMLQPVVKLLCRVVDCNRSMVCSSCRLLSAYYTMNLVQVDE